MLKCRLKEHHRRPPAQCTRLCYLDDTAEGFDPRALQPHWCSHFVVGPADIQVGLRQRFSPSNTQQPTLVDRHGRVVSFHAGGHREHRPVDAGLGGEASRGEWTDRFAECFPCMCNAVAAAE